MILFSFKERSEIRGVNMPYKSFRWVLEIGWWYFGLIHQAQQRDNGEWRSSHTDLYQVCLTKYWVFGSQHIYYDGPHCSFSIGPIHFNWGSWSCKKCLS